MRAIATRTLVIALCLLSVIAIGDASADPGPKRKVVVLEYRAGSSALPGIADRVVSALSKQTSLGILGPDQTRVVYGDQLDGSLVKCAGEAECLAKIGKKVGAAEVILVGVSELGDVILTMQRIDVESKSVSARIADSLAEGAAPSDAQVDAYLQKLLPPTDFLRYGVIDIVANLSGAAVTVGGESRGLTPIQPLKLPAPATYDIRIVKEGYVPYTTKVALPPDGEIKVEAQLSMRGGESWYQRWYVLAAAGVLVAGAGGTAIYFATRSEPSDRVGITGVVQ
ncbi:MAG: PEGA domain-containing protein [Deltaproteobacteria bacterium]|nr:PEGA domain-containing protein [Deltaproteobacteria bacterium]MDQ3299549.1 PEGA domain-containing protein [Myxococcota bacterium]